MRGGDPRRQCRKILSRYVFPACAGVIPDTDQKSEHRKGVPRMRGGDPSKPHYI